MRFIKRIFGLENDSKSTTSPLIPKSSHEGDPIKVFDKFGREMLISRKDWLESVLAGQIKQSWNHPNDLAGVIVQSFNDGFYPEVEEATKQLHRIDTDAARGASLLGILYLQTDRPAEAERVLSDCVAKHGKDGVVLTNLAKAQAALGRIDESERTLWQGLEVDPNQDNGLLWYEVLHREKNGPAAGIDALKRIAALPKSWRARLWLARSALESKDLNLAIEYYHEALGMVESPVPADLLIQISGDLGNYGHLLEMLTLVMPRFDEAIHGILVGNNLIKAHIDTGQLDSARVLLRKLEACQRPDWRENLGYWEAELNKASLETRNPISAEKLDISLLTVKGPLWLLADHALMSFVPPRSDDAPTIVFFGSSFESVKMPSNIVVQPSDNPGRMSRAIPLFLNERVHLRTEANTATLIPWIRNETGGFGVFGKTPDIVNLAHQARQILADAKGGRPADFLVNSHLLIQGENWILQIVVVRTIDGKALESFQYPFPELKFSLVVNQVTRDLVEALAKHAEVDLREPPKETVLPIAELDHYLFRLEQTLAVRCSTMDDVTAGFLSNPAEILDGIVYLCLQAPDYVPSRFLLWRCLDGLKKSEPELVKSMSKKIQALQTEHPLEASCQRKLNEEFKSIFPDYLC